MRLRCRKYQKVIQSDHMNLFTKKSIGFLLGTLELSGKIALSAMGELFWAAYLPFLLAPFIITYLFLRSKKSAIQTKFAHFLWFYIIGYLTPVVLIIGFFELLEILNVSLV